MSSMVCIVYFRQHTLHSEDPDEILGIYTTRSLALEAARSAIAHPDDEVLVREFGLNYPDAGSTIWDLRCDSDQHYMRRYYGEHWRGGFPNQPTN